VAALAFGAAAFPPFLSTWGSKGTAPGTFDSPDNIAVDARGQVYVVDRVNNRVQKFDHGGRLLSVFGTPGLGAGQFNQPRGVVTDGLGQVYIADSAANRIEKFDPSGRFLAKWGRNGGDGTAGTGNGEFNDPRGIATDAAGNLYIADHGNHRVQKLDTNGRFLLKFGRNGGDGSAGVAPGEFNKPRKVAVDRAGNIYVADKGNHRIQKFDASGRFLLKWGRNGGDGSAGAASGEFNLPYSVAIAPTGEVYVTDTANNRLQKFTPAGVFIARIGHNGGDGSPGTAPGEFTTPYGVAVDCRGNLYVTDEGNDRVETFGAANSPTPTCPPAVRLDRLAAHAHNGAMLLDVTCDQPCTLSIRATLRTAGGSATVKLTRALPLGVLTRRIHIALPASVRRSLRQGPLATQLRVIASGFGGTAPAVATQRRISR
jgi:DNA-binding beta-propeller fold protein YncE